MRLQKTDLIAQPYDHVYFSPHLDDVVLSCGGRIALQKSNGEQVLVVSVFTSGVDQKEVEVDDEILAPFLDMQERRKEDAKAMERLQADHLWLDYHEAIRRNPRYQSFVRLTSQVLAGDAPLQEALWSDLTEICHAAHKATLYFPLAVGNHVDHQILFELGTKIEEQGKNTCQVWYYEDVPYAFIPGLLRLRMKLVGATVQSDSPSPALSGQGFLKGIVQIYQGILSTPIIRENATSIQRAFLFLYVLNHVVDVHLRARKQARRQGYWMNPEVIDITTHLQAKLDAVGEYRSQVTPLLGDLETLRLGMERNSASILGGKGLYVERYWRTAAGRGT
jgi:LmbE family N-acetylglucosaminyl deacetylase